MALWASWIQSSRSSERRSGNKAVGYCMMSVPQTWISVSSGRRYCNFHRHKHEPSPCNWCKHSSGFLVPIPELCSHDLQDYELLLPANWLLDCFIMSRARGRLGSPVYSRHACPFLKPDSANRQPQPEACMNPQTLRSECIIRPEAPAQSMFRPSGMQAQSVLSNDYSDSSSCKYCYYDYVSIMAPIIIVVYITDYENHYDRVGARRTALRQRPPPSRLAAWVQKRPGP